MSVGGGVMPTGNKYDLGHIESPNTSSGIEFEKLRFEYAWRHFDMHCRQRLQMFYFFLISVAFLCGALANVETGHKPDAARLLFFIPVAGIAISIVFFLLDARNRALYSISCRHLEALERSVLYPDGFRELPGIAAAHSRRLKGILIEDAAARSRYLRHRFLIPLCHVGGIVLFLVLFIQLCRG
jgi:hypothetical protein